MKPKKSEIIICPNCGKEYLPSEIFIPKYAFGRPEHIERDFQGQILDYIGYPMDLKETYCCDACNKQFAIQLKMQFEVFDDVFNETTTVNLQKKSM